jgi:AraC family transcriptional regulator
MLLRSLPSLTSCAAGFRDWFHSKWGHENCIVWGRALRADFVPHMHSLSIRAAWDGTEHCHFGGRTVGVDDDTFLILNQGRTYSTSIRAQYPVESLAICFRPGLAEAAYAAMSVSLAKALADGTGAPERTMEFSENLQVHDRRVSPVLRFIKAHVAQGLEDEGWYEEQLHFLLERMQQLRDRTLLQIERLQFLRGTTRREIYRRIAVATDFMHTNYAQDIDLEALANVACLSKYHFLRLFTLVHGVTPYAFLQNKRTSVAARLLQTTQLTTSQVASCVGFARRSTVVRRIRSRTGFTPLQLRTQAEDARSQQARTPRHTMEAAIDGRASDERFVTASC